MTGLELLLKQIREKRDSLTTALEDGSAKDYADYRAICGEIRGLSFAETITKDLANRLENSDDD